MKSLGVLFGTLLMLGAASTAMAGTWSCGPNPTDTFQTLDGFDPSTWPTDPQWDPLNLGSLSFTGDCTIKNFPGGFGTSTDTLNFNLPDGAAVIVFDNVKYDGKMSCSNLKPGTIIWWVNGSANSISSKCQDFFNTHPVDTIKKVNPLPGYTDPGTGYTLQSVGIPFTYTLTMPVMATLTPSGYVYGGADLLPISDLNIYDDLTATGADLTYVSNTATLKLANGKTSNVGPLTNLGDSKHLHFLYTQIPAGAQLIINVTVVLDNTAANVPGTTFFNTATWTLDKTYSWSGGSTVLNDVPGGDGVTDYMMIGAPNLTMTKGGDATTSGSLNLGDWGYFTLDVANSGNTDAWDPVIQDTLPKGSNGGMCDLTPVIDPGAVTVTNSGGTVLRTLSSSDYTMSYSGPSGSPACHLQVNFTTPNSMLKPGEHLKVIYKTKLDANSVVTNVQLFNVAGVTQWFTGNNFDSDPATNPQPFPLSTTTGYPCTPPTNPLAGVLLPGAPPAEVTSATAALDCIDAHTLTTSIQGFLYSKTADNLTTGQNGVITAGPGNIVRYNLVLYSLDKYYTNLNFKDDLGNSTLNPGGTFFVPGSLTNVTVALDDGSGTYTPVTTFTNNSQSSGGTNSQGLLDVSGLTVNMGEKLKISFEVTLAPTLVDGVVVRNQADLSTGGIALAISDDPNINGQAPASAPFTGDPTQLTIHQPAPPLKTIVSPASGTATIGDIVTYQITLPGAPYTVSALDSVVLNDTLDPSLELVDAVLNGVTPLTNTSGSTTGLVSFNIGTIPANTQYTVTLRARVANVVGVGADAADTYKSFTNAASFTYTGGDSGPTAVPAGPITIIEPVLVATKGVSNITNPGNPAAAGDTLEYTVTLDNSTGSSEAFDTTVSDILPPNVTLDATFTPTATIGGASVGGFISAPTSSAVPNGTLLVWGQGNSDGSLDIPAGQSLVLTYRVTVNMSNGAPIINSVAADYTSLNGTATGERTGAGCPTITAPNDYCATVSTPYPTVDPTTVTKSVLSDTYPESPVTTPPSVRVGDTVDYRLTLDLREGTLDNLVISDTLPAGLAFDSVISINGDTSAPYSQSGVFTYADIPATAVPTLGQTGTLSWNLGAVTNAVDYNTANNTLVIEYRARVVDVAALPIANSTLLTNNVALSYTGATSTFLNSSAQIDVRQPNIAAINKTATVNGPVVTGNGTAATPYVVDIVNNTMTFNLQACNNGLAPAYGVAISDQLATELDETSITLPVVTIGATTLVAGTDYTYTAPAARGGLMSFTLNTPLNVGACVDVRYTMGFHTDIGPNLTWNNSATVDRYWSLPQPDTNARQYAATPASMIYMTNTFTPVNPNKTVVTPASGLVTIGDTATYEITVPATPVNAALTNVSITDTLNSGLEYLSATQISGPAVTNTSSAPTNVSFTVPLIPAGQQVVIRFDARVVNSGVNLAGGTIPNTVTYNYTGALTPLTSPTVTLTIVEPQVTIAKSVSPDPATSPVIKAGDVLNYTVNLAAINGTNTSNAYDLVLTDTLDVGLQYVPGTSKIDGVAVADPTISGQTLTWPAGNVATGVTKVVTYQAKLSNSVLPGQTLCNNASTTWTSLSGAFSYERSGDSSTNPANTYLATAPQVCETVTDLTTLAKAYVSDTYNDSTTSMRVGDTVVYQLTLGLQEGTTNNVVLTDLLPTGMAYDSLVSITPASGSANYTYSLTAQPAAGATGTLTWNFGTVTNAADGIATNDYLIVTYRARVQNGGVLAQTPTTQLLSNTANLDYTIFAGAPANKTATYSLNVLQPNIASITKTGSVNSALPVSGLGTAASPYQVDVVSNTITFNLQACNSGDAPAYGVTLQDQLATELDETSITAPVVTIGATTLVAGTDYTYTPPAARGGLLSFTLNAPLAGGNTCVDVRYTMGFHTDIGPNLTWNNSATVERYWSLPQPDTNAQQYGPTVASSVYMTNAFTPVPPNKTVVVPTTGEVTIGDTVTYEITVPATPVNAALSNVIISDPLDATLEYVSASQVSGPTVTNTSSTPTNVGFTVPLIPAGQQVVIRVNARVVNSAATNAGGVIPNVVSYIYTGQATPLVSLAVNLNIVEPLVTISKVFNPAPAAGVNAGDELTYDVTLTASGGAAGDIYSDARDLVLSDTLDAGLQYVPGSSTIGGVAVADPAISGQILTWPARDLTEGTTVHVVYKVKLSDAVLAGQQLCNSASTTWTSLSGTSTYERTGSGSPAYNDYSAVIPAPLCVTVNDNTTFAKAYLSDTYGETPATTPASVRVGDLVDYTLTLGLQEGTTNNVKVTDILPTGLAFEGLVSITVPSGPNNYSYTMVSQPTQGDTGTLTWNLGNVTNVADGNAANDFLVITYRARVLNASVLSQTPTTQTLTNNATLDHDIFTGPAPVLTGASSIDAQQPLLTVAKTTTAVSPVDANVPVSYTVSITNSGNAPAYDTVLSDTLPPGMRLTAPTTTSITLTVGATTTTLANLAPSYNATSGIATWNFDSGVADAYTIPAGGVLTVTYTATTDLTLGAGVILSNSALVTDYYSFDNNAVPTNANVSYRQHYGPTAVATVTLNSTMPGDLSKSNPAGITNVPIGQQFTYRITVPATATTVALYDVAITDTLPAGVQLVSVSKLSTWGTWTPAATVSGSTLTITDTTNGIDIPAGQQAEVAVTVVLLNSATNQTGNTVTNTATYSYNQANSVGPLIPTNPVTTSPLTVVGPDQLYMTKSGPTSMIVGTPGTFTLRIDNPTTQAGGPSSRAWDMTIVDKLPNPTPGGMCDTQPVIQSAVISGGVTPRTLLQGSDYTINFVKGTTDCTLTFTGLTQAAALDPGESLLITYQASLDSDNPNGLNLTNYAGVTQWFSQDTDGSGATGQTRTYTGPLDTGTVGTLDNQDAFTFQTASPTLDFVKTVVDTTNGSSVTAAPGDVLHYTIVISNTSAVPLPNFSLFDDLGQSNNPIVSGSLANLTITGSGSTPDISNVNPTGGTNGAGLLDIRNLALTVQGGGNDTIRIEFDVTLKAVIANGTPVSNQADVNSYGYTLAKSSPASGVPAAPTVITVGSSPQMVVKKSARDVTGDPNILIAGDHIRYTITVQNIGTDNATGTVVKDVMPANTTYVPGTTTLNGVSVPDSGGVSPIEASTGMLIHAPAPENTTPGYMRADASGTTANVATITFEVAVDQASLDGTVISNQAFVDGYDSLGTTPFLSTPSDDPATPALNDPTNLTVVKPTGIVYNSISRQPVAGVRLVLVNATTGVALPSSCFSDPAQQGQVTGIGGTYKFELNFTQPECPAAGADYLIRVTAVPKQVVAGESIIIPASSDAASAAYDVATCTADADPLTTHCEAQISPSAPAAGASDTRYYLHLYIADGTRPDDTQIFNNHIPLDPKLDESLNVTKRSAMVNVNRGQIVPYTITVENKLLGTLSPMSIVDEVPPGFKYVANSARYTIEGSAVTNNVPREPVIANNNGRVTLTWSGITLAPTEKHTIKLLLIVGSGVGEGEYVNKAYVNTALLGNNISRIATAAVRVTPDPTFDCTDVIGKVFDDSNRNGYQDKGELGLQGVRVVSADGLIVTTDKYGRFHITCAVVADADRGSNYILKVDDRTLPSGYRITTENPRVERATRGKMLKFSFGATIHKVVRIDMADGVFEPGSTEMRTQWKPRLQLLMKELHKHPSILRVAYMAEIEDEDLVDARLKSVKREIADLWAAQHGEYELTIETEVFWRTGGPPDRSGH